MGLLTSVAAFFGFGVKGNIRFEGVDVHGTVWKGIFLDVKAYGMNQQTFMLYLKNYFYQQNGVRLRSLTILGYA